MTLRESLQQRHCIIIISTSQRKYVQPTWWSTVTKNAHLQLYPFLLFACALTVPPLLPPSLYVSNDNGHSCMMWIITNVIITYQTARKKVIRFAVSNKYTTTPQSEKDGLTRLCAVQIRLFVPKVSFHFLPGISNFPLTTLCLVMKRQHYPMLMVVSFCGLKKSLWHQCARLKRTSKVCT